MKTPFDTGKSLAGSVFKSLKTALPDSVGGLNPRKKPQIDIELLAKHVILPSLPVTDEEMARAAHQDRGQKLARQENWEELSDQIQYAEDCRLSTPGGESAAMLLAFGARSDVVAVTEDALYDEADPSMEGINALEEMLAENYGDYACALVTALAHIDIGWAWRNTAPEEDGSGHLLKFKEHFKRAEDILGTFDGVELDAPSLAAAQCALLASRRQPGNRVADDYETLIDLDPDCPRHMRALGQHLLPAYYGDHKRLELEARRTAARTGDIWGAGAYTWVYFDALALDTGAIDLLDCDFFIEGMKDILMRRSDQHVTNLLASFCAITMSPEAKGAKDLSASARTTRQQLHQFLDYILTCHLQELHPLIWSQTLLSPGLTPPLPSRRALVAKGRQTALRVIAERFADDIANGYSIAFSTAGMYRLPSL
ncbi:MULTISPECIES: hypothetical protein [unclassified Roseovarius]|uniref:hypothetical protein n=1 Tax=unclassified Roseovarius TaxID=2614913 RepID=UPI00273F76B8|nr:MULTISPECIES: hypothetical protein [unclassified Roseovarius]